MTFSPRFLKAQADIIAASYLDLEVIADVATVELRADQFEFPVKESFGVPVLVTDNMQDLLVVSHGVHTWKDEEKIGNGCSNLRLDKKLWNGMLAKFLQVFVQIKCPSHAEYKLLNILLCKRIHFVFNINHFFSVNFPQ